MGERLEDSEWMGYAEKMQLGETRKIPHSGCSNSPCLKISHNENGLRAYCFKCEAWGMTTIERNTIDQVALVLAHRNAKRQDDTVIKPVDLIHPKANGKAISMLLGHGITFKEIEHYGIQYSPSLMRVFIPVYFAGTLINYIGRTILEGGAKWWAICSNKMHYFQCVQLDRRVCIVEDIFSAIKVGRHIDCYALMGTTLSKELLARLKDYEAILVWADSDVAGDKAFDSIKSMCSRYYPNKPINRIRTPNDPKRYDNQFIKEQLNGI